MAHEFENPEVIKQQMEHTRASLAGKMEQLEQQLLGTVIKTTSAVAETAEKVTEAVEGTVDTVKETVETVQQNLDLRYQVEHHPWAAVGGSIALGYVLGQIVSSLEANGNHRDSPMEMVRAERNGSRLEDHPSKMNSILGPELEKLKALALGTVLSLVRDLIIQAVPPSIEEPARDVLNRITSKIGGEPIDGPVLNGSCNHP